MEESHNYLRSLGTWRNDRCHHSYSLDLAHEHGIPAALLLKYFAVHVAKSAMVHDNRRWHCETIERLTGHFRYLSPGTIHEAFARLDRKVLVQSRFYRWMTRKPVWYAFADPAIMRRAETSLVTFNAHEAERLGLQEAIVLHHIAHRLQPKKPKKALYAYPSISCGDLSQALGIPPALIEAALGRLVQAGVIQERPSPLALPVAA